MSATVTLQDWDLPSAAHALRDSEFCSFFFSLKCQKKSRSAHIIRKTSIRLWERGAFRMPGFIPTALQRCVRSRCAERLGGFMSSESPGGGLSSLRGVDYGPGPLWHGRRVEMHSRGNPAGRVQSEALRLFSRALQINMSTHTLDMGAGRRSGFRPMKMSFPGMIDTYSTEWLTTL